MPINSFNSPGSTSFTFAQPPAEFFVSAEHPKLSKAETESIRSFLSLYNQYAIEAHTRVSQAGSGVYCDKASKTVDSKIFVDIGYIKSTLWLGLFLVTDS